MWICIECGRTFEDPVHWEEKHNLDGPPYEQMSGCPYCYGAFTEAHRCKNCDEIIDGEYVKINNDRYCNGCYLIYELGDENI
jgi:hypothetical protein